MAQSEDNSGKWWTKPPEPAQPEPNPQQEAPYYGTTPPWWTQQPQPQQNPQNPYGGQSYQPAIPYQPQAPQPPQPNWQTGWGTGAPKPQPAPQWQTGWGTAPNPQWNGQGTYMPQQPNYGSPYGSGYVPSPDWRNRQPYTNPQQPQSPYHWSGGGTYQPSTAEPGSQRPAYSPVVMGLQPLAGGYDPRAPYRENTPTPDWYRQTYGGPPQPQQWTPGPKPTQPKFYHIAPNEWRMDNSIETGYGQLPPPHLPAPPVKGAGSGSGGYYQQYPGYGGGGGGGGWGGGGYSSNARWWLNPSVWRI